MRKLIGIILVITMLFCISASAVNTLEAPVPEVQNGVATNQKPVFIPITEDSILITPYASEEPVRNEAITRHGVEWYQKEEYPAYRIWVNNETDQEMKVTIGYEGMPNDGEMVFRVDPYSGGDGWVNFAVEGTVYFVDFQTPNGVLAGTCSVQISTVPFG